MAGRQPQPIGLQVAIGGAISDAAARRVAQGLKRVAGQGRAPGGQGGLIRMSPEQCRPEVGQAQAGEGESGGQVGLDQHQVEAFVREVETLPRCQGRRWGQAHGQIAV